MFVVINIMKKSGKKKFSTVLELTKTQVMVAKKLYEIQIKPAYIIIKKGISK